MNTIKRFFIASSLLFLSACANVGITEFLYANLAGYSDRRCRQDPANECPERQSYTEYERERQRAINQSDDDGESAHHDPRPTL